MVLFLRELATLSAQQWAPYEATAMKRRLGLAPATQKALLHALESAYLIRRIPIEGRAGEIILMEDQFEELELSLSRIPEAYRVLGAIFRNVRAQFLYRLGEPLRFFSYWSRSGARVPLCMATKDGVLGFVSLDAGNEKPSLSQRRSADSFLRRYPDGKVIYVTSTPGKARILDARSLICAAVQLL
jgi:hypothetical protein